MRSTARDAVYKYLFAKLYNRDTDEKLLEGLLTAPDLTAEDKAFALRLKNAVEDNLTEITADIERLANNYSYNRIFSADKCALFIGVAEMKYANEVPAAVAIDEAVKLSSRYSAEKSVSFVNGILAELYKEQNNECENN